MGIPQADDFWDKSIYLQLKEEPPTSRSLMRIDDGVYYMNGGVRKRQEHCPHMVLLPRISHHQDTGLNPL